MELTNADKVENVITALIVIPRNNRLYDYYINGQNDKRVMLQKKMLQFCIDLCPDYSSKIRQCILEIVPFIIYPQAKLFKELKENPPPKINRKALLFPMCKQVKNDKIDLFKDKENVIQKWGKNYPIWEKYNIHIDNEIKKNAKR